MQTLVALAVVLTRKGLATHGADEWAFVGVSAKVRAEVVGTREAFGTERALEGSRVFLRAFEYIAGVGGEAAGNGCIGEVLLLAVRVNETEKGAAVSRYGRGRGGSIPRFRYAIGWTWRW